jgi:hypothetical protein
MVFCASMAFAQNGSIAVFSDAGGSDCNFIDVGSLNQVYVWHVNTPGATASEWMLDVTQVGWTHLGDTPDFNLVIGTSINGASLSYEACLVGSFQLMTVNFFGSSAAPCGLIGIVPAPNKPGVRAVDCAENSVIITGGQARVNPDGTCQCAVPVNETTWGNIKALYN